MTDSDPEAATQQEVQEEADATEEDPVTSREALEQDLMAEGKSKAGEELGDEAP
ncbi:MAG TPA: hypothetical protein VM142_10410 [Acidimicrobiales bacterium]|nr:hypothetical protein [Acidimicrobiales bacterium]